MKVAFTGTQSGMTHFQKDELKARLKELEMVEFINGDCVGADAEATVIAYTIGVRNFHLFPSHLGGKRAHNFKEVPDDGASHNWNGVFGEAVIKKERPRAPLERNKLIVDACEMLIACPKEHTHTLRSGTWATIRYAWRHSKKPKVLIIPPINREEV